jgi:transaldolase
MSGNPLSGLQKLGQSVWLDNLSRRLIESGELMRLVREDFVTWVTSNPSIFEKAIAGSDDYDSLMTTLIEKGLREGKELFLGLAMKDISDAADILLPVYRSAGGKDGFVSIEVSPDLAYDTTATVKEAKSIFSSIGKKNVLIKVPATKEGIPAIESLIADGVNVNATLLFSVERYSEVAWAYIRGLEKRVKEGAPVNEIASVASFFVSRVDTLADKLLHELFKKEGDEGEKINRLIGRAAVANARLAYSKFGSIFSGGRFISLKNKGANIQRLLWASTGTKNPLYSDIKYVEELIGPDTVNTMPEATMEAFKDHGRARVTLDEDGIQAEAFFKELHSSGIDINGITERLESEGVRLFSDAFFGLLKKIGQKSDVLKAA